MGVLNNWQCHGASEQDSIHVYKLGSLDGGGRFFCQVCLNVFDQGTEAAGVGAGPGVDAAVGSLRSSRLRTKMRHALRHLTEFGMNE